MLKLLISPLADLASQWLGNKAEKTKAKHERELEVIKQSGTWEELHAEGSQNSWKDEYWTIIFSLPLLAIFYGVIKGNQNVLDKVNEAFAILATLPDWYQYLLFMLVSASVGIRGADKLMKLRGNK